MKVIFKTYEEQDYQKVCDFLIGLNQVEEKHINWNWARWEWMYFHPYFDRSHIGNIGLWMAGESVLRGSGGIPRIAAGNFCICGQDISG